MDASAQHFAQFINDEIEARRVAVDASQGVGNSLAGNAAHQNLRPVWRLVRLS